MKKMIAAPASGRKVVSDRSGQLPIGFSPQTRSE
jgi:hypothetical protein